MFVLEEPLVWRHASAEAVPSRPESRGGRTSVDVHSYVVGAEQSASAGSTFAGGNENVGKIYLSTKIGQ